MQEFPRFDPMLSGFAAGLPGSPQGVSLRGSQGRAGALSRSCVVRRDSQPSAVRRAELEAAREMGQSSSAGPAAEVACRYALRLQQLQLAAFQGQQFLFDRQAAAITGQFAVTPDYPVTRNDDGNGIRTVRQSHRARRIGISDAPGKFPVRNGFAIRNLAQTFPDFQLETGALRRESYVEILQCASKVGLQLANGFPERLGILFPGRIRFRRMAPVAEMNLP